MMTLLEHNNRREKACLMTSHLWKGRGTNHSSEALSWSITLLIRCTLARRGRQTGHHQFTDDTLMDVWSNMSHVRMYCRLLTEFYFDFHELCILKCYSFHVDTLYQSQQWHLASNYMLSETLVCYKSLPCSVANSWKFSDNALFVCHSLSVFFCLFLPFFKNKKKRWKRMKRWVF